MKLVTRPIDGLTVLTRAIALANCPDDGIESLCRRVRLLPPGASYLIDQRGSVYEPLPSQAWRKKTHRASILRCRVAMWAVFSGSALPGTRVASRETLVVRATRTLTGTKRLKMFSAKREKVLRIRFGWPGYWWHSLSLDGQADQWTVPTLDGLVAAAAMLLEETENRSHVRGCLHCRGWFIRVEGKQMCCTPKCQSQRDAELSKRRVYKKRGLL